MNTSQISETPSADIVDVAIVGYGPVGATLAILLAQRGWRVAVLERWLDPYPLPRAVHFDHEAGRILQSCGIGEALEKISEPAEIYEFQNADRRPLVRFGRLGRGLSGWPQSSMFSQPDLEACCSPGSPSCPAWRCAGVSRSSVSTTMAPPSRIRRTGRRRARRRRRDRVRGAGDAARCTPATSSAATAPTAPFGTSSASPMTDRGVLLRLAHRRRHLRRATHVRPPERADLRPGAPDHVRVGWTGAAALGVHGAARREDRHLNDEATAWRLLEPWAATADNARLERHAVYRFQARWVHEWRRGRVLLAGDAAHQTPPFAGQGMCSGLRDAANLAWKLDLVLAGVSPDRCSTRTARSGPRTCKPSSSWPSTWAGWCAPATPRRSAPATRCSSPPTTAASPTSRHSPASAPASSCRAPRRPAISSSKPTSRRDGVRTRFDDAVGAGWRLVTNGPVGARPRDSPTGSPASAAPSWPSAARPSSPTPTAPTAHGSPSTPSPPRCNGPTSSLFGTAADAAGTADLVRSLRDALQVHLKSISEVR